MRAPTSIISSLLDILFPARCVVCEVHSESYACTGCIGSLPSAYSDGLPRNISALFDYQNPHVRAFIWTLKYRGVKKLAEPLGTLLYEELLEIIAEKKPWREHEQLLIVPIPLSRRRLWKRGFNQSALLARAITHNDKQMFAFTPNALVRVKNVCPQTKMSSRAERLKNLKGVFAVTESGIIKGKSIVVIDDVATTGATLSEARTVLLKAGAREVFCLALAH